MRDESTLSARAVLMYLLSRDRSDGINPLCAGWPGLSLRFPFLSKLRRRPRHGDFYDK